MNAVENQVRQLVEVELAAANKRFPQFHSAHEGYAVILEEFEEVKEQMAAGERFLGYMWDRIRHDSPAKNASDNLMLFAIGAACEAIQVAAMCKKFLDMHEPVD